MKKIFSIILLFCLGTSAFAVEYNNLNKEKKTEKYKAPSFLKGFGLATAYYRQLPNNTNKDKLVDLATQAKDDDNLISGNKYIYNRKFQIIKRNVYDAEFPEKAETIFMPNYPKALTYFAESAKETKSPIAAYEGLMIIRTYLGQNYKNSKKLINKFTDILYKNGDCEGYLSEGRKFLYGTNNVKQDVKKAKNIFTKGLKVCSNVSYYGTVMYSKILTANIIIKQKSKK